MESALTVDGGGAPGPAMAALTASQRQFVEAFADARSYKLAGAAAGMTGMQAWEFAQSAAGQAAILEVVRKGMRVATAAATQLLVDTIDDKKVSMQHRLKAALAVLDRGGVPAVTEQKIEVTRPMSREDKLRLLVDYARQTGQDPRALIGNLADADPRDARVLELVTDVPRETAVVEVAPARADEVTEI